MLKEDNKLYAQGAVGSCCAAVCVLALAFAGPASSSSSGSSGSSGGGGVMMQLLLEGITLGAGWCCLLATRQKATE